MPINKLPEFAQTGEKNTQGLTETAGFPSLVKPARQWFNYLFNAMSVKTNEVIDRVDEVDANLTQAINSLSDEVDEVDARVTALIGGTAPTNMNTIIEIANELIANASTDAKQVSVAATQNFTATERKKGRDNIQALGIGDIDVDEVTGLRLELDNLKNLAYTQRTGGSRLETDGWLVQWGEAGGIDGFVVTGGIELTVTLPISYGNNDYSVFPVIEAIDGLNNGGNYVAWVIDTVTGSGANSSMGGYTQQYRKTATQFKIAVDGSSGNAFRFRLRWKTEGFKTIASASTGTVTTTGFINTHTNVMDYSAPVGNAIVGFYCEHSNATEDRIWKVRYAPLTESVAGFTLGFGAEVDSIDVNAIDGIMDYSAPDGHIITGMYSTYQPGNDRIYRFRTRPLIDTSGLGVVVLTNATNTGWLNNFDGVLDFTAPQNTVITKVYSYHSNDHEDRRWVFSYARVNLA